MRDTDAKVNRRHAPVALLSLFLAVACAGGTQITIVTPPPGVPTTRPIGLPTTPPIGLPTQPAIDLPTVPAIPPLATPDGQLPSVEPPPPGQTGPTPWPAPPATPEPEGYAPLVGRWTHSDEFVTSVTSFLPDGRYVDVTTVGDTTLNESGTYAVDGTTLTLIAFGEGTETYELALYDGAFTLLGGAYSTPTQFDLEPGSPESIVAEAQEVDANEAQLDADWRARLPVAPMGQQPPHVALGEVPEDPNVTNIFGSPTIFVSPELYLEISLAEVTYDDGSTGSVQNSTKWYFEPTGRLYTIFTNWPLGRIYSKAYPQPDVNTYWSRYTIVEGSDTDRVLVETDAGEQIDMYLAHGRRNLVWGNDVYGQVDWENEQMQ
jgi:hypothetical protein